MAWECFGFCKDALVFRVVSMKWRVKQAIAAFEVTNFFFLVAQHSILRKIIAFGGLDSNCDEIE